MENSTHSSPLILAMDTSAGISSVALFKGELLASAADEVPGQQSRNLVLLIEKVLKDAGVSYAECDSLACALGPGGFTSVRVGVAAARAIALAASKPLIGLGSLDVMAYASGLRGDVVAVIDAHRQQFYVQRFRVNGLPVAQSAPMLVDASGLKAIAHGAKLAEEPVHAAAVAALAHACREHGRRDFPLDPIYIREPDAKLPA